ncbi:hypothetical protein Q5752_003639 [Cryptotrichosporon argae]
MFKQTLLVLGAVASVHALSTTCETQLAAQALGSLGSCLQLTDLLPVLDASGSIVSSLNTYLGELCSSSTPTCSNSTLASAYSSLNTSCASDVAAGGSDGAEVEGLLAIVGYYAEVQAAACSTNTTTGDYCVTDALNTVQTVSGQNVTVDALTAILAGDATELAALESVFATGQLCTDCTSGIYYELLLANATVASTSIGSAIASACGTDFGKTSPTTLSSAAAASSNAATSSSASSGAGRLDLGVPLGSAAVVVLGVLAGAAVVL